MKTILNAALMLVAGACLSPAATIGTSFTYQGRLSAGTSPATGVYDLRFTLYDALTSGNLVASSTTNANVGVSNGLFTVSLDFGDVFNGEALWLETAVRTNGGGAFTLLQPRQAMASAPFARYAANAGAATLADAVTEGAIDSTMLADGAVTAAKIGEGALKSAQIDDGGSAAYESVLGTARSLSDAEFLPFSSLSLVVSNTGTAPSLTFALDGAAFGTVGGFVGHEGISETYEFVVEVTSSPGALHAEEQIGRQGRLTFARNGRTTSFAGVVSGCAAASSGGTNGLYTFRIEPLLTYLALKTDYVVSQNVTVPSLATTLYQSNTGDALSAALEGSYANRECVIQFGETALNFVSRLLEEEGIFYFFQQGAGAPVLKLGDAPGAYLATSYSSLRYLGNDAAEPAPGTEYVRTFHRSMRDSVRLARIRNYDFEKPASVMEATADAKLGRGEAHRYGSPWTASVDLTTQANRQVERQLLERVTMQGTANAAGLRAGYTFTLDDRSGAGVGGAYLLTAVRHAAFRRVTNGVASLYYGNEFEVMPAAMPYRPATKTRRPLAQPCTAVVTGPAGDEIYVDKYGRVKVEFHWDRYGNRDAQSSAWVRVATPWAGQGRGVLFLPRVGDEVLVSFLQGNPDQPVVTGSLFNAANATPYSLPASKTVSTIKTKSSKGGGGANEIRFDDLKGSELLAFAAAKDMTVTAANDVTIASSNELVVAAQARMNLHAGQGIAISATAGPALRVAGDVSATRFQGDGSNLSNLPTTNLTGTISDTRLSANVALRNGGNVLAGQQVITSGSLRLSDQGMYFRGGADMNHGLGWFSTGSFAGANPDGPVLFGCAGGALGSFCDTPRLAMAWNSQGNVVLDPAGANAGMLTPGLTFGPSGKEGIASRRSGGGNLAGLDFYTLGTNRMSLTSSGSLGIGTANPARRVHIVDADGVGGSVQVGAALAGPDAKLITFGDGDYVHIGETGADDQLELKGSTVYFNSTRVGIGNTNPTNLLMVGIARCNGLSWINASDRNAKENVEPVAGREVLAKVATLPISRWTYKNSDGSTHLGPMAQDFHAAFALGVDDTSIATVDADGVALAAIQGLHDIVQEKDAEIQSLKQRLERLEQALVELRR